MAQALPHPVLLPPLSIHGALTLGTSLLSCAEPVERRPIFLVAPLLRLDESLRELRGAIQYRSQLQLQSPSRQQRARADVDAHVALDAVLSAMRSYVLRVSIIVDDTLPETVALAQMLLMPLVDWEMRHQASVATESQISARMRMAA